MLALASNGDLQDSDQWLLLAFNVQCCLWHGGLLLEQPATSDSVAITEKPLIVVDLSLRV